jgi:hypothetical protein
VFGHLVIIANVDFIYSYGIVWQQNMEEISYSGSRDYSKKKLPRRLLLFSGLFLVTLFLLGSVGYFITRSDSSSPTPQDEVGITLPPENQEVSETQAPTQSPSPTPAKTTPSKSPSASPTVAKSTQLDVSVQNGSGVTGAAKSAAAVLTTAGYNVVSTGNADTSDYTDITIQIKNSKKSELAALDKALSKEYTVGSTSTDLSESTSYDALVIVGK